MAELGFNSQEQDAKGHRGSFEVIAPGWARVVIVGSEVKATKDGAGKLLEFKYELQDGTGRTIRDWLNIVHGNEVCQKIGRGALAKVALAVGHKGDLSNTNVLHGRPFEVLVTVETFESNKAEDRDPVTGKGKELRSNKCSDYRAVQAKTTSTTSENKAPAAW